MRRASTLAAPLLFSSIFFALVVPLCFWPAVNASTALIGLSVYALVCVGMSVELSELLLALFWKPVPLPALADVSTGRRRRVAVLMTICDDGDEHCLLSLRPLADAGYQVFLLDDSAMPAAVPDSIETSITVVRRNGRQGAKAGNINHWLKRHGEAHDLCILLDSDSVVSPVAADALVRVADHPGNAHLAILQASVLPHLVGKPTWVQRVLAAGATVRRRIYARVHARLDTLLSFGHNQLLRLSALRAMGGMDESRSAEDTVLSLRLAAAGFGVGLVDVGTHDTDPRTLDRYLRRTVRWARQTVELFSSDWYAVPLRYKLVLCWHLLSYLMPILTTVLLLFSLWRSPTSPAAVVDFTTAALSFEPGYEWYGVAIWPGLMAVLLRTCLATAITVLDGGNLGGRIRAALVGGAIQAFVLLPLMIGMLTSARGNLVPFEPTNSTRTVGSIRAMALGCGGAIGLFAVMLFGLAFHPGGIMVGLNGLWCIGLLGVPVLVFALAIKRFGAPRAEARDLLRRQLTER